MFYPKLKAYAEKYRICDRFSGMSRTSLVPEGSFYDCMNLSSDKLPLMSIREKRGILRSSDGKSVFYFDGTPVTAVRMINSKICVCTEKSIYIDGIKIENAELEKTYTKRTVVPFGRDFYICPDALFIKENEDGFSVTRCNKSFLFSDNVTAGYCTEDSTEIFPSYFGEFPVSAVAGELCARAEGNSMALYEYTGDVWIRAETLYIRIGCRDGTQGLSPGMSVIVTTEEKYFADGDYIVRAVDPSAVVLEGVLTASGNINTVSLESRVPYMDFAVEHGNRIWGCRFGENARGEFVNELYASALGDPTAWNRFQGISTDSYSVSLGVHGTFTGAVSLGGEILFFKENHIIRITGESPSEFSVSTFPARGVQAGQSDSITPLNERVFYKNNWGITVYDGAFPVNISAALGNEGFYGCTGAAVHGRYYCAMTDTKNERRIYVFDTASGQWFSEDDHFNTVNMFSWGSALYFLGLADSENCGYTLTASSFDTVKDLETGFAPGERCRFFEEEEISWFCETGDSENTAYPYRKTVRSIKLKLSLSEDSEFSLLVRTDRDREFVKVFSLDRATDGVYSAHVNTVPCHSLRLRFEGKGDVTVYSYSTAHRNSSEVNSIE